MDGTILVEFNNYPTRCDLFSLLHFCRQLYMFQVLTPKLYIYIYIYIYRLCGLVVRVSGYIYRGPGFDPRHYQIF